MMQQNIYCREKYGTKRKIQSGRGLHRNRIQIAVVGRADSCSGFLPCASLLCEPADYSFGGAREINGLPATCDAKRHCDFWSVRVADIAGHCGWCVLVQLTQS
jgi:hypothetical protein